MNSRSVFARQAKNVVGVKTAEEAIEKAGLDWTVSKRPVMFQAKDGPAFLDGKFAIVRDDNDAGLGVVGRVYETFQNKTGLNFMNGFVQDGLASYHSAYSLKGGRNIVLTLKLPKEVYVAGKDALAVYLQLSTAHDGSSPIDISVFVERLICSNGLTGFVSDQSFSIRHTSRTSEKIAIAKSSLNFATNSIGRILEEAEAMVRTKLNSQIVDSFLNGIGLGKTNDDSTRKTNIRQDILRLQNFGYGHNEPAIKNSVWTMYNAVTQYVDHNNNNRSDDSKLYSAWFGHGANMKTKALETALTLVK